MPTPGSILTGSIMALCVVPAATEFDPLLAILANERRGAYRNEVLKELRAEAKLVINRDAKERSSSRDEDVTEQ